MPTVPPEHPNVPSHCLMRTHLRVWNGHHSPLAACIYPLASSQYKDPSFFLGNKLTPALCGLDGLLVTLPSTRDQHLAQVWPTEPTFSWDLDCRVERCQSCWGDICASSSASTRMRWLKISCCLDSRKAFLLASSLWSSCGAINPLSARLARVGFCCLQLSRIRPPPLYCNLMRSWLRFQETEMEGGKGLEGEC